MGKIKQKNQLIKALVLYVAVTFGIVALICASVIVGCYSLQKWLLPEENEILLNMEIQARDGQTITYSHRMKIGDNSTEFPMLMHDSKDTFDMKDITYNITYVENGVKLLTPKKQILYTFCSITIVLFPMVFSLAGVIVCGVLFYRNKLKKPIELLSYATDKISEQDLDFEIKCSSNDEMGLLCLSYEKMRKALQENYKKMWYMIDERKKLQASVAHDLRNPIAIIQGYTEYLQLNLPLGEISKEKLNSIVDNIGNATKRLEKYTEAIYTINNLEEIEIYKKKINFSCLYNEMIEDFKHLTDKNGIIINFKNEVNKEILLLDPQVLYRVLENLIGNAIRFAREQISLTFLTKENILEVVVADDGVGYPDKVLNGEYRYFLGDNSNEKHLGIGIAICKVLCKKHGGDLLLSNSDDGGAVAKIKLKVD